MNDTITEVTTASTAANKRCPYSPIGSIDINNGSSENNGRIDNSIGPDPPLLTSSMSSSRSSRRRRLRQQPSQHCVSFSPRVFVTNIESTSEYTDEEIKAMHYQPHEYEEIRQSLLDIINAINAGAPPRRFSSRGLEHRTKAGKMKVKQRISQAIDLVYDLQVLQLGKDSCHPLDDASIISSEYADFCFQSSVDAYLRGKQDEMIARRIIKNGSASPTSSSDHCRLSLGPVSNGSFSRTRQMAISSK